MAKDDGGPAFPGDPQGNRPEYAGMTLRDYFAAAALQAIVFKHGPFEDSGAMANWSYNIADAMLAERVK